MEVIYKYDDYTNQVINEINMCISNIKEKYENKLNTKTANECEYVANNYPNILNQFKKEIEPYQKELEKIYLNAIPKIIIKDIK